MDPESPAAGGAWVSAMKRRTTNLLLVGGLFLGVVYVGLPPLLDRVMRVEEWQRLDGGPVTVDLADDSKCPHVTLLSFYPFPVPQKGFILVDYPEGGGKYGAVVLRWNDGGFLWEDERISLEEVVPYVDGLLKANKAETVYVFFHRNAAWGEVVSVVDHMRGCSARNVGLFMAQERP